MALALSQTFQLQLNRRILHDPLIIESAFKQLRLQSPMSAAFCGFASQQTKKPIYLLYHNRIVQKIDLPVENVIGCMPFISHHGTQGPQCGFPQLAQSFDIGQMRVDHLQVLKEGNRNNSIVKSRNLGSPECSVARVPGVTLV